MTGVPSEMTSMNVCGRLFSGSLAIKFGLRFKRPQNLPFFGNPEIENRSQYRLHLPSTAARADLPEPLVPVITHGWFDVIPINGQLSVKRSSTSPFAFFKEIELLITLPKHR